MNRYKTRYVAAAVAALVSATTFAQGLPQQGPSPAGLPAGTTPQQPLPQVQQPPAAAVAPAQVPPLPQGVAAAASGVSLKPGAGMSPEAFAQMLNQQLPLNPKQVKEVNVQADAVKKARNARVGPAPKPVSVTARVSLAAGANPHVLRLSADTVTSVVFNDVTGAPWNITKVVAGGKDLLDVSKVSPDAKTNMFTVTPLDEHFSTNIAIFLEGAPAPVMMVVATNQAEVDFRVDVSVQARGPGAVMPAISRGLAESVPAELTSMVSGITPNQAKPLKIVASDVADVQAWVIGDRMYVRSRANVLAPPVPKDGKVATGADGTKVYELPHAPEVLLMQGGSVGRLRLAGFPPPTMAQLTNK